MKKILFGFVFLAGLLFAFGLFVGVVKAGCAVGYHCVGTTLQWRSVGCTVWGLPGSYYCGNSWDSNYEVTCDSDCKGSFTQNTCTDSSVPMSCVSSGWTTTNTNCCAKDSATPTPTPGPGPTPTPTSTPTPTPSSSPTSIPTPVSTSGKTIIKAEVVVYWNDAQGYHEVKSATSFADWRQR